MTPQTIVLESSTGVCRETSSTAAAVATAAVLSNKIALGGTDVGKHDDDPTVAMVSGDTI